MCTRGCVYRQATLRVGLAGTTLSRHPVCCKRFNPATLPRFHVFTDCRHLTAYPPGQKKAGGRLTALLPTAAKWHTQDTAELWLCSLGSNMAKLLLQPSHPSTVIADRPRSQKSTHFLSSSHVYNFHVPIHGGANLFFFWHDTYRVLSSHTNFSCPRAMRGVAFVNQH